MKEHITLCGREFEIVRSSRRKRIAIGIDSSGNWFIGAPERYGREHLLKTLENDREMTALIDKLEKKSAASAPTTKTYQECEELFFRGERLRLHWVESAESPPVELREGAIYISSERRDNVAETLEIWYGRQLYHILREVLPHWTKRIGVAPKKIAIKRVKTLWGSCSAKGSITFSTRLALVPPPLLEYVIVHELIHMRHMNHSAKFWQDVETYLPDYMERRKELKEKGSLYQLQ